MIKYFCDGCGDEVPHGDYMKASCKEMIEELGSSITITPSYKQHFCKNCLVLFWRGVLKFVNEQLTKAENESEKNRNNDK